MPMRPFSYWMYPDTVQIRRVVHVESGGREVPKWTGEPEPEEPALVEHRRIDRVDGEGRATIVTVYDVRMPMNRTIAVDDQIVWTDANGQVRYLTAKAPSVPEGIGDIQYLTECVETQ